MLIWQEKITKEMNYILSNQDTVLAQITQLESSITQTEVINTSGPQNLPEHGIKISQQLLQVFVQLDCLGLDTMYNCCMFHVWSNLFDSFTVNLLPTIAGIPNHIITNLYNSKNVFFLKVFYNVIWTLFKNVPAEAWC